MAWLLFLFSAVRKFPEKKLSSNPRIDCPEAAVDLILNSQSAFRVFLAPPLLLGVTTRSSRRVSGGDRCNAETRLISGEIRCRDFLHFTDFTGVGIELFRLSAEGNLAVLNRLQWETNSHLNLNLPCDRLLSKAELFTRKTHFETTPSFFLPWKCINARSPAPASTRTRRASHLAS